LNQPLDARITLGAEFRAQRFDCGFLIVDEIEKLADRLDQPPQIIDLLRLKLIDSRAQLRVRAFQRGEPRPLTGGHLPRGQLGLLLGLLGSTASGQLFLLGAIFQERLGAHQPNVRGRFAGLNLPGAWGRFARLLARLRLILVRVLFAISMARRLPEHRVNAGDAVTGYLQDRGFLLL
jgi:hypothetical protein